MTVDGWLSGTCSTIEHDLDRGRWTCHICGLPWPCIPARVQLGEKYAGDPRGLAMLMTDYLFDAVADFLPAGPSELYDRFVSWTRYPPGHPFEG